MGGEGGAACVRCEDPQHPAGGGSGIWNSGAGLACPLVFVQLLVFAAVFAAEGTPPLPQRRVQAAGPPFSEITSVPRYYPHAGNWMLCGTER